TGVAELAGLVPSGNRTTAVLEDGSQAVRDTPRLAEAIARLVADPERRRFLHDGFRRFVTSSEEMLGRWASVMLGVDTYAELIDRHVELGSDVSWVDSLLGESDSPAEQGYYARLKSASHPAMQVEGEISDESLVQRLVAITQLAEDLDRLTLQLALRLVPLEWWAERLGTTATVWSADSPAAERAERAVAGRE